MAKKEAVLVEILCIFSGKTDHKNTNISNQTYLQAPQKV